MQILEPNHNKPLIMHIDLNSAFASIEQQARPHLRGRPVAVAAYSTPNACIVAPSIEAKKLGIKTGFRVRDARLICPDIVVLTPDPQKYRDFHLKFRKLVSTYSPDVTPKSIDEVVINFSSVEKFNPDLVNVALEIKKRIRTEIGDFLKVSIGIGANRFLAKTGAGLHKPDGLDVITHKNLLEVYKSLKLTDLCGINSRFAARLNAEGIFTPLDFYNADELTLKKVFKSILSYYWSLRLRGYEIDDFKSPTRSIGNDYALYIPTDSRQELSRFLLKLSEKTGRRLRRKGLSAYGVHAAFVYEDWTFWHKGKTFDRSFYTTKELYKNIMLLFGYQPVQKKISKISIACFNLVENGRNQLDLFDESKVNDLQDAMDEINDRYGEFVISPALMMGMNDLVLDRIAFGGVKEMENIYGSSV